MSAGFLVALCLVCLCNLLPPCSSLDGSRTNRGAALNREGVQSAAKRAQGTLQEAAGKVHYQRRHHGHRLGHGPHRRGQPRHHAAGQMGGRRGGKAKPRHLQEQQGPDMPDIISTLKTLKADEFLQLINTAGLAALYADPQLMVTLFVPVEGWRDKALAAYPALSSALDDPSKAGALLAYNTLPAAAAWEELGIGELQVRPTLLTATHDPHQDPDTTTTLTLFPVAEDLVYGGGLPPGTILNQSITLTAGNSRIYLTTNLLVPPSKGLLDTPLNAYEALQRHGEFSTLLAILDAEPIIRAATQDRNLALTLLAPTDAAFEYFLTSKGMTIDDILGTPITERYTLNHMLPFPFHTAWLEPGETPEVPTLSSDPDDVLTVTFTPDGSPVLTVQGASNPVPIRVLEVNLLAGKSVVHVLDGVVVPAEEKPLTSNPFSSKQQGAAGMRLVTSGASTEERTSSSA